MESLHVLRLGEELLAEFTRLHTEAVGAPKHDFRQPPLRRLNSLFEAMAPGVLATGRNAGADGRLPWLYARETVPREVLAPLIGTWASGMARSDDEDESEDSNLEERLLVDELAATTPHLPAWEVESVDLTETVTSAGGTAEPAGRLYGLLPEAIAFRLAARPFRVGGATLHFRVAESGNGTRLVSWPPRRYEHRGQTWYYSARVTIAVHTVPFAPRFRVHVSTGVRRWATRLEVMPHRLTGTTVLFDVPLPWSAGADRGYRLTPNTLGYDRQRREIAWRRHSPAPLLPELDIVRRYPRPTELFTSPEKWINGRGDVAAGLVYHPQLGPHGVGSGLMPRERAELDAWVEEGLRPVLRRADDLTRVTRHNTPALLPRAVRKGVPDTREVRRSLQRRAALARALNGRPLEIEILWQSPQTRDALLAELPKLIGLPPGPTVTSEGDVQQWRTEGVEITVRSRPAGSLAGALPIAQDRSRRRAVRLAEAIEERSALVARRMAPPDGDVGVVVAEIAGKDRFEGAPDSDPKHALRVAWARRGWLSQFVNLPADAADTLDHRARWTWLDAFRQIGAIGPPPHRVGDGIPGHLQYAALWLVRYTRKGPTRCPTRRLVAVRVRPGDGPDAIEGWDSERAQWVPYRRLLLLLAEGGAAPTVVRGGNGHGNGAHPRDDGADARPARAEPRWREEIERQIRTLLFQLRERPTMLLADAGNLRQCWPYLRNGSLVRDMLGFGAEPGQRLTVYGHDLRVVLVRDANGRREVPEWYAHDTRDRIGFSEGVWGATDAESRVFASTASTPHTAAQLPRGLMKLAPAPNSRTAPGKTAWNPGLLEVTVLGCLSEKALADSGREGAVPDRPAEWATLAHQLRYHDDYPPLARPLPLHLARLAGEYVLPLAGAEEGQTSKGSPPR